MYLSTPRRCFYKRSGHRIETDAVTSVRLQFPCHSSQVTPSDTLGLVQFHNIDLAASYHHPSEQSMSPVESDAAAATFVRDYLTRELEVPRGLDHRHHRLDEGGSEEHLV
jgi:hypothetical protein